MTTVTERIRSLGLALGFDAVGFGPAAPGPRDAFLHEWLERGYAGEMAWIGARATERADPRRVLAGARTAIAVALCYDPGEAVGADARVARYAGGEDYHDVMADRLRAFESAIEVAVGERPGLRSYVDTGPVLERAVAARAGLGWIGKNTLLLNPTHGSYFFLGVVLTDLPLDFDEVETDHCGSCRACLDACPTQAFPEPYVLDATRCLSYTTIEHRGETPLELRAGQGDWVFGCDICQEVCPWNGRSGRPTPPDPLGLRARLAPRGEWRTATLAWLLALDASEWREETRRTALRRAKYAGLMRNALIAAGNSGDETLRAAIERHRESGDSVVRDAAEWALAQLKGGSARD